MQLKKKSYKLVSGAMALAMALSATLSFPSFALAADTGFKSPTTTGTISGANEWSNPTNAFSSNDSDATETSDNDDQSYETFGFNIPTGSVINGIEVTVEAASSDSSGCEIETRVFSAGAGTTSSYKVQGVTGTDTVYTLGGAADLWGLEWIASDFSDANFYVEVQFDDPGSACNGNMQLDHIQAKVYYTPPTANPALADACGVDMALLLDMTGSIESAGATQTVKDAANSFVSAFLPATPSLIGLVELSDGTATEVQDLTSDDTDLASDISGLSASGATNWEAALLLGTAMLEGGLDRSDATNPDLMVVITDGDPNEPGSNSNALTVAIQAANAAKSSSASQPIRIVAVGVAGATEDTLVSITGPNVADTVGEITASTDVVLVDDFSNLTDALASLANALCEEPPQDDCGCLGPVDVTNVNEDTAVINFVDVKASTGGNTANGGSGGSGGNSGSAYIGNSADNNIATSGSGGAGGNGGAGGSITTGAATAGSSIGNQVNWNNVSVSRSGSVSVLTLNSGTFNLNGVGVKAKTGYNAADGGSAGTGGTSGSASVSGGADDNNTATSGNGGAGGHGGAAGSITTGPAGAISSIINAINTNIIAITL